MFVIHIYPGAHTLGMSDSYYIGSVGKEFPGVTTLLANQDAEGNGEVRNLNYEKKPIRVGCFAYEVYNINYAILTDSRFTWVANLLIIIRY